MRGQRRVHERQRIELSTTTWRTINHTVADHLPRGGAVDPAVAHERDAVGQRERLGVVVGDVNCGLLQPREDAAYIADEAVVERRSKAAKVSSASSSFGSGARARASATRCASPPDPQAFKF